MNPGISRALRAEVRKIVTSPRTITSCTVFPSFCFSDKSAAARYWTPPISIPESVSVILGFFGKNASRVSPRQRAGSSNVTYSRNLDVWRWRVKGVLTTTFGIGSRRMARYAVKSVYCSLRVGNVERHSSTEMDETYHERALPDALQAADRMDLGQIVADETEHPVPLGVPQILSDD